MYHNAGRSRILKSRASTLEFSEFYVERNRRTFQDGNRRSRLDLEVVPNSMLGYEAKANRMRSSKSKEFLVMNSNDYAEEDVVGSWEERRGCYHCGCRCESVHGSTKPPKKQAIAKTEQYEETVRAFVESSGKTGNQDSKKINKGKKQKKLEEPNQQEVRLPSIMSGQYRQETGTLTDRPRKVIDPNQRIMTSIRNSIRRLTTTAFTSENSETAVQRPYGRAAEGVKGARRRTATCDFSDELAAERMRFRVMMKRIGEQE